MHNPNVPETLEGWSVLHHMLRLRWSELRSLSAAARAELATEAAAALSNPESQHGHTGVVHLLGHKADLMVVHLRRTFDDLSAAQLRLQQTRLWDYMEMTTSYVSIVELGMYDMTAKIHQQLANRSLKPGSDEFERA